MILPILAAFTIAQTKTVTFDEPAGTADHILAHLGKACNIKLEANAEAAKEVLLISVKDVPVQALLNKIAKVTAGQWDQKDGALVLIPDQGAREAQRQAEIDASTIAIKKAFKEMKDYMEGAGAPSKGTDDDSMPLIQSFGMNKNSLLNKYVLQLDPAGLAQMRARDRVVFASTPNGMQLQLPEIDSAKIDELIKSHNEQVESMKTTLDASPEVANARETMKMMGMDQMLQPIPGPPAKILLSIDSGNLMMFGGDSETATVRFYDQAGKVIYSDQGPIPGRNGLLNGVRGIPIGSQDKPEKEKPKQGKKIEYSPLTLELRKLGSMSEMTSGSTVEPSAELKNRLMHPDDYDPLSFSASEGLKAAAAEKQEQLVADLPDAMAPSVFAEDTPGTTTEYLAYIQAHVKIDEKEGWLQITPTSPNQQRFARLDRKALAALVQSSSAKGGFSLDDMSSFALANDDPNLLSGVAMPYFMFAVPGAMSAMQFGSIDWDALRLYATMGMDQRLALRKGSEMPVSTLTPVQRELVNQMVFGAGAKLEEGKPAPSKALGPETIFRFASMGGGNIRDYLQEPTEALPQGLPNNAVIQCDFSSETVVCPADKGAMSAAVGPMDSSIYGMFTFMTDNAPAQLSGQMPKFKGFRLGSRDVYNIHIKLLPNVFVSKKLVDDSFAADTPIVTADNFPADFKARAKDQLEAWKKSPFANMMKMGMPGMPTPAP